MNALTVYENKELEFYGLPMSPDGMQAQVNHLQYVMSKVMRDGEHYGKIPGCGDKPTLLKPGAEKICMTFRLSPSYEILRENMPDGHREYQITCTLTHIPSNQVFGQGVGSCTTMEGKYRFRRVERKCPECGIEAIIKGKQEYGGGWVCFTKKGGCNKKWRDEDSTIENLPSGRTDHDNPADYYNTVLKMAKKRALVDAVLTATAASDIFTQDIEEIRSNGGNDGGNNTPESKGSDQEHKKELSTDAFTKRAKEATAQIPSPQQTNVVAGSALEYVNTHMVGQFNGNTSRGRSWLRSRAVQAVKNNSLDANMQTIGGVNEAHELPEQVLEYIAWEIKESEAVTV
jgi:hypothetical protein